MSARIDKAVILAAGSGSRLGAVSDGRPKPLMPLNGEPGGPCFLDWHIACLTALGIGEIVIVGNSQTYGWQSPHADYARVRWLLNPGAASTGSGHSLALAAAADQGILDRQSRLLLMDADIVYDPAVLAGLAAADQDRSKILVASRFDETGEEVLVFAHDGTPRVQGKGLFGTELVAGLSCLGEATGMLLFEPGDHAVLARATAWAMRFAAAGTRSEHEDIVQLMMALGRLAAVTFADRPFLEVDTPADYTRLVEHVYPQLAGCVAWRTASTAVGT
jgi:choline kinase